MISLLPSEIARLILNYLGEENLPKTYDTFLNECKYLEECKILINRGIVVPKTIHGKTLCEYLVIINPKEETVVKKRPTFSTCTQTDPIETNSISIECKLYDNNNEVDQSKKNNDDPENLNVIDNLNKNDNLVENCDNLNSNPSNLTSKCKINESSDETISNADLYIISDDQISNNNDPNSICSSIENYSPNKILTNTKSSTETNQLDSVQKPLDNNLNSLNDDDNCPGSAKKRKLLIGKNVEKVPELSVSTIERHLDSFIKDAAINLNQQQTQEPKILNQNQNKLNEQCLFNFQPNLNQVLTNSTNSKLAQNTSNIPKSSDVLVLLDQKDQRKQTIDTIKLPTNFISPTFIQQSTQNLEPRLILMTSQPTVIHNQQIQQALITNSTRNILPKPPQSTPVVILPRNIEPQQPQSTPVVILPRSIEPQQPVLSKIQPQKDPVKNIQPILANQFQKVNFTNVFSQQHIGQNASDTQNKSRNRTPLLIPKEPEYKNARTKLTEAINQAETIVVKKKKSYTRVTPTIRAIYEKNDQKQTTTENAETNTNSIENNHMANEVENIKSEAKDVHDEIEDIFDLPYVKSTQSGNCDKLNNSDSNDISLEDIIVKKNATPIKNQTNTMLSNKKSSNTKLKKNLSIKAENNSDDELDKWFSDVKQTSSNNKNSENSATRNSIESTSNTSTRTLRSRTNSKRKMV